jgi:hypothetical protein
MTICIPTICVGFEEAFVNFRNAFVGLYPIALYFEKPNVFVFLFFEIKCIMNND